MGWRCGVLMIVINFLSWRERLRYKRRRRFIVLSLFGCLLIISVILPVYVNLHRKIVLQIKRRVNRTSDSSVGDFERRYKLSGVILQNKKHWALILMPNNKVIIVKSGDSIGKVHARVKQITSAKIAVLLKNKLLWLHLGDKK